MLRRRRGSPITNARGPYSVAGGTKKLPDIEDLRESPAPREHVSAIIRGSDQSAATASAVPNRAASRGAG